MVPVVGGMRTNHHCDADGNIYDGIYNKNRSLRQLRTPWRGGAK